MFLKDAKIGAGQLTSDNLIDEDYEAELGIQSSLSNNLLELNIEADTKRNELKEQIDKYGIVNVCGSDFTGRPIIVLSACKLPENDEIAKEQHFKSHQHFFDCLLEYFLFLLLSNKRLINSNVYNSHSVLVNILEKYVESEYTLVYFHYGLKSTSQPSFNWLAKVYRMLDRK